jgi:CO/xanthine dehydrogenase Mo-binding subunit
VNREDLEVAGGRVFARGNPHIQIAVKDICYGYVYPDGSAIGGQIIGRGHYIQPHMKKLDPETGAGKLGPEWAVGAQAVEVELDTKTYTYKLIQAFTVMDAGQVLNQKGAESQVMGGMNMGLSFANREQFIFNEQGVIQNPSLRTYHPIRYGENAEYLVKFIETPFDEGTYGARALGEHGALGMPAALACSLSKALGIHLNQLPLLPEYLWRMTQGGHHDSI